MNTSCMSLACEEGIRQFLAFALERTQPDENEKYFCPCINCFNERWQVVDNIQEHLLCAGINKNYTTWIWHGELTDMQSGSLTESSDVEMGDQFEDMICDLRHEFF